MARSRKVATLLAVAGTPVTFSSTGDGAPGDRVDVRCFRLDSTSPGSRRTG